MIRANRISATRACRRKAATSPGPHRVWLDQSQRSTGVAVFEERGAGLAEGCAAPASRRLTFSFIKPVMGVRRVDTTERPGTQALGGETLGGFRAIPPVAPSRICSRGLCSLQIARGQFLERRVASLGHRGRPWASRPG